MKKIERENLVAPLKHCNTVYLKKLKAKLQNWDHNHALKKIPGFGPVMGMQKFANTKKTNTHSQKRLV